MTRKIFKALVATVSLAALVLGTGPSMAHGHGGGGGGRGGGGMVVAVTSVAATLVVVTSEVAENILVVRISAAPGSAPLTSVAVISAACRAATSLTLTPRMFTD